MNATTTKERPSTQQQPRPAPAGNLPATQGQERKVHPLKAFKSYFEERMGELQFALPSHISPERFQRTAMTALQRKPELLACTKQSLWNACLLAAHDGLLPDGREGAIVPYGENANGKRSKEVATWMPMIEGYRKKARNSGEILNWEVHAVRARDKFHVQLGDDPKIEHQPYFGTEEPGPLVGVYSIATLKDGEKSRDVMTIRDVEKIRAKSKAGNGPWSDPAFFNEMAKKTVARRHYKQLPHSSDLDEMIRRDDEAFGLDDRSDAQIEQRQAGRITSTASAFDRFAGTGSAPMIDHEAIDHDPETGEAVDGEFSEGDFDQRDDDERTEASQTNGRTQTPPAKKDDPISTGRQSVRGSTQAAAAATKVIDQTGTVVKDREPARPAGNADKPAADASPAGDAQPAAAGNEGEAAAGAQGGSEETGDPVDDLSADDADDKTVDHSVGEEVRRWPPGAVPSDADEYEHYADTKIGDFQKPDEVAPWWKSKEEVALRKTCGVGQEMFERIRDRAQKRVAELTKQGKK